MAVEVLFGGVAARLRVLRAYGVVNYPDRTEAMGRMGSGRDKQCNYLLHRPENIAMGFHSGESVLYRAVRGQPQSLAQS
jgi:hypothetical protein